MSRKIIINILLLAFSILCFVALFELVLLISNLDFKILIKELYYQCADPEVQMVSNDSNRLYELCPNSTYVYYHIHPKEIKYTNMTVTVNSLGFRDKERNKTKPEGVIRIIILGGSNTYGAAVTNNDTYPAIMQRLLDERYPGKFEVWNAGLSGYVLSQQVAYADYILQEFNPDLLIFSMSNAGRRGFLMVPSCNEVSYKISEAFINNSIKLFYNNKELFSENIPLLLSDNQHLNDIHYRLIPISRTYRFLMICINNMYIQKFYKSIQNSCPDKNLKDTKYKNWLISPPCSKYNISSEFYQRLLDKYASEGEQISQRNFDELIKKYPKNDFMIFNWVAYPPSCDKQNNAGHNMTIFSLCSQGTPEEYYDIHPPSYVYEWYAEQLLNEVMDKYYPDMGFK